MPKDLATLVVLLSQVGLLPKDALRRETSCLAELETVLKFKLKLSSSTSSSSVDGSYTVIVLHINISLNT